MFWTCFVLLVLDNLSKLGEIAQTHFDALASSAQWSNAFRTRQPYFQGVLRQYYTVLSCWMVYYYFLWYLRRFSADSQFIRKRVYGVALEGEC